MAGKPRRLRALTIVVLVASATTVSVIVLGESAYSRYVLYRLESAPSLLGEFLDGSRSRSVEAALAAFLETSEGQDAWRTVRFDHERTTPDDRLRSDVVRFGGPSMLRALIKHCVRRAELMRALIPDSDPVGVSDATLAITVDAKLSELASELVDLHFEKVISDWAAFFGDASPAERAMALKTLPLDLDRSSEVVPVLARALTDPVPQIRARTVFALGKIGPPALSSLTRVASERDGAGTLRQTALRSIGTILRRQGNDYSRDAVDALTEALADPDREVVREALFSVIRAERGTEKMRERLRALLDHEDAEIRFSAEHALEVVRVAKYEGRS